MDIMMQIPITLVIEQINKYLIVITDHTDPQFQQSLKLFHDDNDNNEDNVNNKVEKKFMINR